MRCIANWVMIRAEEADVPGKPVCAHSDDQTMVRGGVLRRRTRWQIDAAQVNSSKGLARLDRCYDPQPQLRLFPYYKRCEPIREKLGFYGPVAVEWKLASRRKLRWGLGVSRTQSGPWGRCVVLWSYQLIQIQSHFISPISAVYFISISSTSFYPCVVLCLCSSQLVEDPANVA